MSEPNATPTRADVLREFIARVPDYCSCPDCTDETRVLMADEIVRLRAQRDAIIERLEAAPIAMVPRAHVLAALREGGDDGR